MRKYLLILACSQRKRQYEGKIPAIKLYDGNSYRILRKMNLMDSLDVMILSAKYGLISSQELIENYDLKMTDNRAKELKDENLKIISRLPNYDEIYVDLGKTYLLAIGGFEQFFLNSNIVYAKGGIGQRLGQLKRWLEENCTVSRNASLF